MDGFRTSTSAEFDFIFDPKTNALLDATQKRHIFAMTKELISNSLRHSLPSRVETRLRRWGDGITVEVVNDGKPPPPDSEKGEGRGLKNIRARCKEMNAEFRFSQDPPNLTRASVFLPLSSKNKAL